MLWKTTTPFEDEDNFVPFHLTLTFETKAEAIRFHKEVMPLLNPEVSCNRLYGSLNMLAQGLATKGEQGSI